MEFKIHDITWSDEKNARFWDWYNANEAFNQTMFEYQAGRQIINFSKKFLRLERNILNYGAGKGFLVDFLLAITKAKVTACDFSDASIELLKEKYSKRNNFKGAIKITTLPSDLPSNYFDVVFFLDTIEHLTDVQLHQTLTEISRVLKKGGHIILTTRYNENLEQNKIMCPECGCVFHRVQHIRSFDPVSLERLMNDYGFLHKFNGAINLNAFKNSFRGFTLRIKMAIKRLIGKEIVSNNLIYIGQYIGGRK